ncbi:flippase [Methanocella sp. MCL-LM]|uniref:flippase n=1 Tax=Methanocella sp. MCL-LM TaxID=3412035 RepID=UPI003C76DF2A
MVEKNSTSDALLALIRDVIIYVPSQLVPIIVGFIGLSVYTRQFSPSEYGEYSLILTTVGIFGVLTYTWFNTANIRYYNSYKNNDKLDNFFSTSFVGLFIILAIATLIYSILNYCGLFHSNIQNYFFLTVGMIISNAIFELINGIFRASRKAWVYSIAKCLTTVTSFILSISLIFIFQWGISALLISVVLTNIVFSASMILIFKLYRYMHLNNFSLKLYKDFLSYGIPMIAMLLSSWIIIMSSRYIIEYFRGNSEVGIYTIAYQIADPLSLVAQLILTAAVPIFIETYEKHGKKSTVELISKISRYYILFAIPAFVGIFCIPSQIMWITGSGYSEGYAVLPWVCFGGLMFGLCLFVNKGLELTKNTRVFALLVGMVAIVNIVLNFLLIPQYGYIGAGITNSISYLVLFILSVIVSKRYLPWKIPIYTVIKASLCAACMGLALMIIKPYFDQSIINLLLLIGIGSILYAVLLFATGEIKNELDHFVNYVSGKFLQ